MGLLGSAFGRGLAGAAAGASSLASRYIDEEITANRAKMLEELRHGSMVKTDQYQNSPERQALLRQNATDATMAQGAATDSASLARLNNTDLQVAQKTRKDSDAADETARKLADLGATTNPQVEAANAKIKGTMNIEAERAALIADAQARIAAKYRPSAGGGKGGGGGGGAPGANIGPGVMWDDKASALLRQRATVIDPITGATRTDGDLMVFGKAVALAQSSRNGGDLDNALGVAFAADERLRAEATDAKGNYDFSKHAAGRKRVLDSLMQTSAPAPPPAAPGPAPAPTPPPPPRAAPGAPRGPNALRAPPAQLKSWELVAIKPGHPAYEPAQQELRKRAQDAADQKQGSMGFDRGY